MHGGKCRVRCLVQGVWGNSVIGDRFLDRDDHYPGDRDREKGKNVNEHKEKSPLVIPWKNVHNISTVPPRGQEIESRRKERVGERNRGVTRQCEHDLGVPHQEEGGGEGAVS